MSLYSISFLCHLNTEDNLPTIYAYIRTISVPDEKLGFELEVGLVSSHPWVTVPKHLCMWSGGTLSAYDITEELLYLLFVCFIGRQFIVEINPNGLDSGVHYAEVSIYRGYPCNQEALATIRIYLHNFTIVKNVHSFSVFV